MKLKNRRISKKFNENTESYKNLKMIFDGFDREQRMSFLYAVCFIQTSLWYLFNRTVGIDKINYFFITDYLINNVDEKGNIRLHYLDIARYYFKKKNCIDIDSFKERLLSRLSKVYKRNFIDFDDFFIFYINEEVDNRSFNNIAKFIDNIKEKK